MGASLIFDPPRIEPAQGWIFNEKGQVTLVTQANASQRSPLPDKGCPVEK